MFLKYRDTMDNVFNKVTKDAEAYVKSQEENLNAAKTFLDQAVDYLKDAAKSK